MTKKITLIRHGETAWSLSDRHTGLTDIPLTPKGEEEAKLIGKRLKNESFAKVLISPLKRASDTAKIASLTKNSEMDSDLLEWNYGKYEGWTSEEIKKQDPNWTIFTKGGPNGESIEDVCKRADRVLKKIESIRGDVALVSSGHFLRLLATRWLHLPPSAGQDFILSTASLSILSYEHNVPAIALWNDTDHLR